MAYVTVIHIDVSLIAVVSAAWVAYTFSFYADKTIVAIIQF